MVSCRGGITPSVWTEERQWAPLWEDIVTVANQVVVEGAIAKSPAHFLGAIVIQQEENPPGSPQRFLVIDGQQRLATLTATRGRGRPSRRGRSAGPGASPAGRLARGVAAPLALLADIVAGESGDVIG